MLNTLYVERDWVTAYNQRTILRDSNNKVKAIISSSIRQPKFKQKTIVINCWTFALNWDIVAREKQIKKESLKTERK